MDPYNILQEVLTYLQENMEITVCESYPSTLATLPLKDPLVSVDLKGGNKDETTLTISVYVPDSQSSDSCRTYSQQIQTLLEASSIEEFRTLTMQAVSYEKTEKAYMQTSTALFRTSTSSDTKFKILCGKGELEVNADTKVTISRAVEMYYSPIAGAQVQDLGLELRVLTGSAYMDERTFLSMAQTLRSGLTRSVTIGLESFTAKLTKLSGRPGGDVAFTFQEVPQ